MRAHALWRCQCGLGLVRRKNQSIGRVAAIAVLSVCCVPVQAQEHWIAVHLPEKKPPTLWEQMLNERSPDLPRSHRCENGDIVQLMVTKVNHGEGNLRVAYLRLNDKVVEGLFLSRGIYGSFRRGNSAKDFYDRDSSDYLGFDSWVDHNTRRWRYSLLTEQYKVECF